MLLLVAITFGLVATNASPSAITIQVCNSSPSLSSSHHSLNDAFAVVQTLRRAGNDVSAGAGAGAGGRGTALHQRYHGDIIVEVCPGILRHRTALTIDASHTSPHGDTVVRGASVAPNPTILEAGVRVIGFQPAANVSTKVTAVWSAPMPHDAGLSRQLWVNSARAVRAHANPADCSGGPVQKGLACPPAIPKTATITATGYGNVPTKAARMGSWIAGAEFVYGRGASGASWTEPRCTVASVTPGDHPSTVNITMSEPCWSKGRAKAGGQSINYPSDIENALPLLDEAGEWYGDWKNGVVYYAPLPGQTPETVKVLLGSSIGSSNSGNDNTASENSSNDSSNDSKHSTPAHSSVAAISIMAGATRVRVEHITFTHLTWLEPSTNSGYVDLQSGYYFPGINPKDDFSTLNGVPGAVYIHGAKDVNVTNCTFAQLGTSGVVVDGGSQQVAITASVFTDISGNGIGLGNVSAPMLSPADEDAWFTVANNTIRATGAEYSGCAGVVAGYVAHTDIVYNDIANTSNGAICIGWGWGAANSMRSNRVNRNRIVRSNTVLFDCGSIYTLSMQPGSEVAYNYIVDQVLLYGSLYHDARSGGFHTHHNVVVGGPMWLYLQWGSMGAVDNLLVENNYHNQTVAGGCALPAHVATCQATGFCPTKFSPCGNLTVANNTVVDGDAWPQAAKDIASAAGVQNMHYSELLL